MPDQLAHIVFARRVLAAAQHPVLMRVNPQSPVFRAGTFGPDPLFNDPSPRRRAEGFEMHRRSGRESLERMRRPIKEGMPWAVDYAAGFFCHYALDRLCHPDIKAMAASGEVKHVGLEAAYDRALYLRGNRDVPRRIILSRSALETAAQMYQRVESARLKLDIEAYWQIRRILIYGGGTPLAHVPGRFMPKLEGLIPYANPTPAVKRGIEMLDELMENSVVPAVEQLELYMDAILKDLPLSPWADKDFSGFQTQL